VFVLVVTEELPEWEDAKSMGRVWVMEIIKLLKLSTLYNRTEITEDE
jgi:hypothetical protein